MITMIEEGLNEGHIVVLDGNNLTSRNRNFFNGIISRTNSTKTIIDFGAGSNESLQRRIANSPEYSPEYWIQTHNYKQAKYEQPTNEECNELIRVNQ